MYLRNKDGEVAILDAHSSDLLADVVADGVPHGVGPRPQDVAARHVVVLNHLPLGDHLRVPVRQVCFLGRL